MCQNEDWNFSSSVELFLEKCGHISLKKKFFLTARLWNIKTYIFRGNLCDGRFKCVFVGESEIGCICVIIALVHNTLVTARKLSTWPPETTERERNTRYEHNTVIIELFVRDKKKRERWSEREIERKRENFHRREPFKGPLVSIYEGIFSLYICS